MMFKNICLICAATVLAWVTMLILMWSGFAIDKILLATLMGMSVGAIATKYAQGLVWKTVIVILGLPFIWFTVNGRPLSAGILFGVILLSWLLSVKFSNKKGLQQTDRFKDCC